MDNEEEMDALSHVDSEQGDVPQAELESMRKRIRKGEVDTKRMLQWIADATEAAEQPARAAERGREEPGFVSGKRKLQRGGAVPYGRVCPALSARIEVEFEDAVYCGTVISRRGKTVCTVLFDADGARAHAHRARTHTHTHSRARTHTHTHTHTLTHTLTHTHTLTRTRTHARTTVCRR